jgi:hypothetical protein
VLSDFGIAATLSESDDQEAVGLSIPWSAPEVLMDETAGTIESEVWAFAATIYSLLAGRSPFEVPGGSNKSTDLISRINRAKPEPIGRADVPRSLERALATAMSRNPRDRQSSVLELIREFQAVETELGVPQTPIEVAMDDWALATVADLEDRTHVRAVPGSTSSVSNRRKKRRAAIARGEYDAVGTLIKESAGGQQRSTGTRTGQPGRAMQALAWGLVTVAVLVIALGATATLVLIKASSTDIPVVSDIAAKVTDGTVEFSWADPGIAVGDSYQIATSDGGSSIQRAPQFVVDTEPGEHVCITVTVNRDGKTGAPSSEKCADVPGRW